MPLLSYGRSTGGRCSKRLVDDVEVEKIDIMVDQEKAREYGLMAVPAIALNGVVKFVGSPGKEEL